MRKSIAIVFLALLLFNVLGYYGLFLGLGIQNDREMIQNLDADNYDQSETVTIKIPITVPYASDSREFSRVDGTFQHNGEFYRLVKQALLKDTLHIVCVKDHESKRINQALASIVQTFTDKPASEHPHTLTFSDFIKDYLTISIVSQSFGWEREVFETSSIASFLSTYYPSINHPPERA